VACSGRLPTFRLQSTGSSKKPNSDPKPFVWTADAKRVLAAVKRGKEKLESIH
jgi:hypothetical protein